VFSFVSVVSFVLRCSADEYAEASMVRTFPEFGYGPFSGEWNDMLAGDCL